MVASAQPEGGRWRGLALTTVAVLGLHLALLHFPVPQMAPDLIPGKILITRQVQEATQPQLPPKEPVRNVASGQTEKPKDTLPTATKVAEVSASDGLVTSAVVGAEPSAHERPPGNRMATEQGAAEPNASVVVPQSAVVLYKGVANVQGRRQEASGRLVWQQDGDQYTASLETKSSLSNTRLQSSEGRVGPEGLSPTRYADRTKSELAVHFQREKGLITFSSNAPSATMLPGAQDHLSVVLQVAGILSGNNSLRIPGASIALQTASSRQADVWVFRVIERPSDSSDDRIHLKKDPARPFDESMELWLSPQHGFMPARFRSTYANGDFVEMDWIAPDQ